jgi:hypothetical protein
MDNTAVHQCTQSVLLSYSEWVVTLLGPSRTLRSRVRTKTKYAFERATHVGFRRPITRTLPLRARTRRFCKLTPETMARHEVEARVCTFEDSCVWLVLTVPATRCCQRVECLSPVYPLLIAQQLLSHWAHQSATSRKANPARPLRPHLWRVTITLCCKYLEKKFQYY